MTKGARGRGFTLIELIVFIVVAGIFIPMAYIAFMAASRGSLTPERTVTARFLAETKVEDLTGLTYASIITPQASYANVTLDPRFGSPPMPSPNPYTGYQWRWTIQSIAYQGRTTHGVPTISVPESWQANQVYRVGDYVSGASIGGITRFYRCVPFGRWQSLTSYPLNSYISPTAPNNRSYRCSARPLGTYPTWQAVHIYSVGDFIEPTISNGSSYRCLVAGTSGASEPSLWPSSGNVADGSMIWTEDTNNLRTSGNEPNPWPTNPGDIVYDGSIRWETWLMTSGSSEPAPWPNPQPNNQPPTYASDGSLRWQESTAYKSISVYVREPKGHEYIVNSIVTARPGAYP